MPLDDTVSRTALSDLCDLSFDASFVRELPADPVERNIPRAVRNACYTRVDPTPVRAPQLLAWANPVGEMLGLSSPASARGPVAEVLSGNRLTPGMQPHAARYGGHQFGHWAGQLGDGRAITLGDVIGTDGKRRELQLKGAGPTPYCRGADGRAVLRSSVREFLCSEAMHCLGVPTTRALSLTATGEPVVRDMFYDGHPRAEHGAIVCRVAPSFVRFGNFEILAAEHEPEVLRRLADYVINHYFPELGAPSRVVYARWFDEICRRTATLVAQWMRVGFVHGVLNTDNMSILGLTIDYGPYGWLEGYDPRWTPNTTDAKGRRYCFGNQPSIAQWNLARLAEALASLVDAEALAQGLAIFRDTFEHTHNQMLAQKLGLESLDQTDDERLVADLIDLLQQIETDMTLFFRCLAAVPIEETVATIDDGALVKPLSRAFYTDGALEGPYVNRWAEWLRRYGARVRQQAAPASERSARMNRVNPKYVLRNYLAQQAIDALEGGDVSVIARLMTVLQRPYHEQPEHDDLADRRPEWARNKAGCSSLSCSS